MKHQTIFNTETESSDHEFNYQKELTTRLDAYNDNFDQSVINEIVLWKVNRYALITEETIKLLNAIKKDSCQLNEPLTIKVLEKLLSTKGIRLPMASTILRFKNPRIYQIIDQRAYRLINDCELKIPSSVDRQIAFYLDYLNRLREICGLKQIPFEQSDRVLYEMDKRINKHVPLRNYGK